jgi:hypothetical protein
MKGAKQRREENNFKNKMRNGKMVAGLCREKKNDNFLGFCLFGVNGQKKIKVSKEGCHVTLPLV